MTTKKIRVGVVFGGRSGEHEVSLASAKAVMENLDPEKYAVVPIGITKAGQWLLGTEPATLLAAEQPNGGIADTFRSVTFTGDPTVKHLIPLEGGSALGEQGALDVIIPVLHGTYGEDGTLQGLLEMANVPYVGCGVLGAAVGMDKEKMKMIFDSAGLPNVNYLVYRRNQWARSPEAILDAIETQLGYPNFVKPVNLGSSVGINKAHNRTELEHAINVAAEYDRKIIIEQGINCREFECAVLGNDEPIVSVVGEIIASNEFYDYNAKYIDNQSQAVIPANIPQQTTEEIRRYAIAAFQALDLSGLSRIDFFLDKDSGKIYINEVNTLPGFTEISMYPKLWAASGIPYSELLERLIELAQERYEDRQHNRTNL
ncbi:D-alanine--D-alanine ligase family protein [Dictyobacter arantiisoli]|uniref:D-alanine--D-alanine ligase n=1 Tax=Dictyobacter arantiisoli TaxID=2014874 RepID=A0A5A5TFA6_9CHLR|nr:D-alanine--D-alanine ligase family protein [Dictyobacter arantiisoli]GCF09689.1 D-alanine--D-alanine ligase A [Dictyobacter arantiisoli]